MMFYGYFQKIGNNIIRFILTQDEISQPSEWICRVSSSTFTEGECITEKGFHAAWKNGVLSWHTEGRAFPDMKIGLAEKARIVYDTAGEEPVVDRVLTVDGERNFVKNLVSHARGTLYEASIAFSFDAADTVHGLGQAEDGIYDRRRTHYYMYQNNMRIPIPFLFSGKGWSILFDCGCLMCLRADVLTLDAVKQLDMYLITGSADECIGAYRHLTGRAPLLPKWAFGYIQSKEAYRTQEELVGIAREYRTRGIPLDCVVQDWNTWEPGKWGEKILDESRYPDMRSASDALHKMHVHTLVSVWPNMNTGTENYRELEKEGKLLYDLSTYDAFDERAREIYWRQMKEGLFDKGFDGWWCDSTEPFCGPDWSGTVRREEEARYALVGQEHTKFLGQEKANLYALAHSAGIWEHQRREAPEKRVVNLTRSGWAGSQSKGTILWSGDICARWDVLRKQIAEGLNMAMSGHPYWTFDIGGFFVVNTAWQKRGCGCSGDPEMKWFWNGDYNDGADDPAYRELYTRWLQLGCFMPIFRSHGTDTPREVWNFGKPGEIFYDAIVKYIRLRYRLMPYVYSLAADAALEDKTILRPLLFDFPEDPTAESDEMFLFGKSMLVCPVTKPMYYDADGKALNAARTWCCHLPAGCDWYDWNTGVKYSGGDDVTVYAGIDTMPLFVRAGSVLPLADGLQSAEDVPEKPVELRIFAGDDGTFSLYEDAGDGYGYEDGEYARIPLTWNDKEKMLLMGKSTGRLRIRPRTYLVTCEGERYSVDYDGNEIQIKFGSRKD